MKKQEGFTLLEMLIVIAILGTLAAIALPRYYQAVNKARTNADRIQIAQINTQIELYNLNTRFYLLPGAPATALFNSTSYFPDGSPVDPFGNISGTAAYSIDTTGGKYRVNVSDHQSAHGVLWVED